MELIEVHTLVIVMVLLVHLIGVVVVAAVAAVLLATSWTIVLGLRAVTPLRVARWRRRSTGTCLIKSES